jgi:outer membrane receptor protein involved in Fe transport
MGAQLALLGPGKASSSRVWPGFRSAGPGKGTLLLALLALPATFGPSVGAEPQEPQVEAARTGSVEGVITTADGRPLGGAQVSLVGLPEPTGTSGVDGSFRLSNVPVGSQRLRAELQGYGRGERPVEVRAAVSTRLRLALPFLPFSETVTVTATRSRGKLGDSPAEVSVLTREDLQFWPAPALDDALKQVPSFSLFRRTDSLVAHPTTQGVSLRGVGASGASRTLVLVDGVPHNDAFGNWVYWDDVPQLQIESIEVAPSGLSSLYGSSAMAGVINVSTRPPESGAAALRAYGGSRSSGNGEAFGSHAWGPVAASVGGSYFRTDGYVLVKQDERGAVDEPAASRHRTGNWRVDYTPKPGLTLFQNGRVFAEDRENGTPLQRNSTRETYLGMGLRATSESGSLWQANAYGRFDDFKSSFSAVAPDRESETLSLAQAVDYKDAGGNLLWSRPLGSSHTLGAGADVRWMGADDAEDVFIPSGTNVRDRLISAQQLYAGAYVQDVVNLGRRAVLNFGVRADYWGNYRASQTEIVNSTGATTLDPYDDTSKTRVTPRGGVLLRLGDGFSLRGNLYGGFRAPSLNELYRPFRVGNVQTTANPDLGPERLLGGELGLNHSVSPTLSWRATGFWDQVDDPIANVTLSVTSALITRQRQNLGKARVRGLSFEGEYQPAHALRIVASYVLSDARVTEFPASPEIEGNLLPQVPRHRASLRLDYLNPRFFNLGLRGRYESLRYDDDQNLLELANLFLVDLTLDRPLAGSMGAFVSIENLFDRSYPVQATPLELQGTPFTLTAGLRFELRPR